MPQRRAGTRLSASSWPERCRLTGAPSSVEYLDADGQSLFLVWQPECTPVSCAASVAILEPDGHLPTSSPDDSGSESRALFIIRGSRPAPNACAENSVQDIALGLPDNGGVLMISVASVDACLGTFVGQFVPEVPRASPPTAPRPR